MVQYKCGKHYIERYKKNQREFSGSVVNNINNLYDIPITKTELYTSYLGKISLFAKCDKNNIYLETIHITKQKRSIIIKIIDLLENSLNDSYVYPVEHLVNLKTVCINRDENLYKYAVTLLCYLRINEMEQSQDNVNKYSKLYNDIVTNDIKNKISINYPELINDTNLVSSKCYKKILQKALEYNSRVDIMFAAVEYLNFINEITNCNIDTINNQNILIFISGVPKLDNAYWNGSYMIFGNGDSLFYPLTSLDVIGHELTHGLLQGICDLEYKGHSGALNESYADIFGTMLEFYVYDKYSTLLGKCDWCIGEDLVIDKNCLRSMQNPHECGQPAKMYDQYYVDPNSMIDYGGVHINSGIPNHCFYLISQNMNKYDALKLFIKCLYKLFKQTNFLTFGETLFDISLNDIVYESLAKVGLSLLISKSNTTSKTYPHKTPVPIPNNTKNQFPYPIPCPDATKIPLPYPGPNNTKIPIPHSDCEKKTPRSYPSPERYPDNIHSYPSPKSYPDSRSYPDIIHSYPDPRSYPSSRSYPDPKSYPSPRSYPDIIYSYPRSYPDSERYNSPESCSNSSLKKNR